MLKKILSLILLSFIAIPTVSGQTEVSLEQILSETTKQTANYQEAFRNLVAIETKIFEDYDKNGALKKQHTVEANFLVYQSSKNPKIAFELRNVLKVDGKPIPNSGQNSEQFFAELSKTSTLKSELEKIQKTSSKYDKTYDISGLTLYEGIILSPNLQPSFEFNLIGNETFQNQNVYVVSYRQIKPTPFISINGKGVDNNNPGLEFSFDMPGDLKKNNIFLQGKFWIDANNFQIWREERELIIDATEPLLVMQSNFEYQPSKYEILVPKQVEVSVNQIKKIDGKYNAVKDTIVKFNYSEFRRTESDVKILDDTEP